jgi:hypothetical protein
LLKKWGKPGACRGSLSIPKYVGLLDSKRDFKRTLTLVKKLTVKEKGIPQREMPQTI